MAKSEWGVKRVCQSCAVKFYDLNRSPITCPKCAASFDPEALLKSRRSRPAPAAKVAKPEPAAVANLAAKKPPEDDATLGEDGGGAAASRPGDDGGGVAASRPDDDGGGVAASRPGDDGGGVAASRPGDDEDDGSVLQDTSELGDNGVSEVVVTSDDDNNN